MKKCIIIYNPLSGHLKKQEVLDNLYNTLEKNGYETKLIKTERKKHACEIVENLDHYDLVICAGGDGTLNETITGNDKRTNKLLLAHLPFGTCNDVGTMYGFTKNYLKDVDALLNGVEKTIDVCKINDHPFIYVACFGDFIDVSYETPREMKATYGRLAYIFYGIGKITRNLSTYKLKYKIDDKEVSGEYSFIFVTNSSRVAGVNDIYKDVKLDDKKFEVVFCKAKTKVELLSIGTQMIATEIKNIKAFEYYKTDNLIIEFEEVPPKSWGIDGEEYPNNNKIFTFSLNHNMKMLMPQKRIKKLFENN
ncbi:MAG: YegS/Rv2252/BmrU family lipid kinase [Bacilli bacterium]